MTGSADTQIKCTFAYNVYESADKAWCVYKYRDSISDKVFTAVGARLPRQRNLAVILYGSWALNKNTGRKQFEVSYAENDVPNTKNEIIAYLGSLKCGIGSSKAERIYSRFGDQTWRVLEKNPELLKEVEGISDKTCKKLICAIAEYEGSRKLLSLFSKANITVSGNTTHRILLKKGKGIADKLVQNPFLIIDIEGITIDKCDALAVSLGFPKDAPERLRAYIHKILSEGAVSGHVCLPKDELLKEMSKQTEITEDRCITAINDAVKAKEIRHTSGFIYLEKMYNCEVSICKNLVRLSRSGVRPFFDLEKAIDSYETSHFTLAEEQRDAVRRVFTEQVSIITGGPGVGKTTVLKAILWVHERVYGESSHPILVAPTGKAARRMTETTGYQAQTIHSAVNWRGEDADLEVDNTLLTGNIVLIDETSMMDQNIAAILLNHIADGTKLVFIGDIDQLPSVGCGYVLHDMISSGTISTTRLNVIFRQAESNPIVANSHKINAGKIDLIETKSFRIIETHSDGEAFLEACKLYCRCVKAYGTENVVLLNPQRNNTELSVENFNLKLQQLLNPHKNDQLEIHIGKNTFRAGDKVMELRNTELAKNGDVGYIRQIVRHPDPDEPTEWLYSAQIEFNNDGCLVAYTPDDLRHVAHAWCSTVHKSQGSEYQTVIQIVSKAHPSMLKKNLIYTGITRAKQNVAIIGERDALKIAVEQNNKAENRYTLLTQRLRAAFAEKE